jgi:hypothetical protein
MKEFYNFNALDLSEIEKAVMQDDCIARLSDQVLVM